jgi:2-polyprenyl-3-methyl-5-hydroxy-6-metoxy-1,4-benzoquinol methylase
MNKKNKCIVCHSDEIIELLHIENIPVFCNVLHDSQEKALSASLGNINLCFCKYCGHIYNSDFNSGLMEYDQEYENSLHFSKVFQTYAEELSSYLIEKYNINNKKVIDIGCGKGDFLKIICNSGNNKGFGFDKSYVPKHNPKDITFIQDFFTDKYTGYNADLILCRQVLEHIEDPNQFLKSFETAIRSKESSVVFFEVPNAMYTIKELGIWDLIYEHCSYYTTSSLCYLFLKNNYKIIDLKTQFEGQYLSIELSTNSESDYQQSQTVLIPDDQLINNFKDEYLEKISKWKNNLSGLKKEQKKTVVWGAGSKGITFLNLMDPENYIQYIVDVSPQKQDLYVPGTGQKVISPEDLIKIQPDAVVLMNNIYEKEVRGILKDLGLKQEILYA